MTQVPRLFLLILLWSSAAECAKILVFLCEMARSHHIVYHPIIRELAVRGHEVDYFTHHPMENPPNKLKQTVFPLDIHDDFMVIVENVSKVRPLLPQFEFTKYARSVQVNQLDQNCFTSPPVVELLSTNRTYDMVIGEFSMLQEDIAVLVHKFKALGVSFLSLSDSYWLNELSGFPNNPSYMVSFVAGTTDQMSFVERLTNFVDIQLSVLLDYYTMMSFVQKHADQFLTYEGWETRPSVTRLASDMALVLVSSHHSLGYAYPKAPHVKEILGTNVDDNPPPLPKDIQEFVDSAEHGVVYFSLGTIVSVRVIKLHNALEPLLRVFSKLKQKVLWKWTSWSGEEPPDMPNIKFVKWVPQQSLLAHKNVKLFITHGGLGSITEAVASGVPVIGIAVLADQERNVKLAVKLGLGLELQIDKLKDETISKALNEILSNPKYKQVATKRSIMFRDRPMKPVEEAVYWIEYVLRHGNVLQPASVQMPFYQLYLLDIFALIFVACSLFVFLSICLFRALCRLICGKSKTVETSAVNKRRTNKGKLE